MFHFDWPALLGMMLFLLFLRLFEEKKVKSWAVILVALLSCLMGRGYATCAVVLLWFLVEAGYYFPKFKQLKTPFLCLFGVTLLSGAALFYNVKVESLKKGVPLEETGIVKSMQVRTGMKNAYKVPWGKFLLTQGGRFIEGGRPLAARSAFRKKAPWRRFFLFSYIALILLVVVGVAKNARDVKSVFLKYRNRSSLIIALSGFIWLFPMKRLAYFHNYTNMYYLGFYLILGTFVGMFIRGKYFRTIALSLSFFLFIGSIYAVKEKYDLDESNGPNYTADFDAIREKLDQHNISTIKAEQLPNEDRARGTPYAHCFYLGERFLSPKRIPLGY